MRFALTWMAMWLPLSAHGDEGWREEKVRDGITVWSRPHTGSKVVEVRGLGVLPVPAERLFAVLGDVGRYSELMPPTEGSRRLAREGSSAWFHLVLNPPVVSRRDYCIKVTLVRDEGSRPSTSPAAQGRLDALRSIWAQTDEHCPAPAPGMVRMRFAEGKWTLRPKGPSATEVEYVAFTDPGGALPGWAVNRSLIGAVFDSYAALAKAAMTPRYEHCAGESFGCP